jgi:FAD/FMN-containing dehydrogenase
MDPMSPTRRQVTAGLLTMPALLRTAHAAALPPLPNIAATDALLLRPGDPAYDKYQASYSLRTQLRPALRILTRSTRGIVQAIDWVRGNALPFALRSGGHSYEGFSQSSAVVIDTRLMNRVDLDDDVLTVGAGATLGAIYRVVAARGLGFPGGSCPTVGVAGHSLGGGFGLIARDRGLACDALEAIELVDANAKPVHADADNNADLFWACRGGGGGTFGAASRLRFRLTPVGRVAVYTATWALAPKPAAALFDGWQHWAHDAPDAMTGFFRLSKRKDGRISLHLAGQSLGPAEQVRRELRKLTDVAEPSGRPDVDLMSYMAAVDHFSGGWNYPTEYSKSKSDFISGSLSPAGIDALIGGIAALPAGEVLAICDAYGGAIDRVPRDATAFAHRAGTAFCIQYYTSWGSAAAGERRQNDLRRFYAAMRPYSAGCYVNYCDLDLADWEAAYWRENVSRLRAVKSKYDPENLFRHAQSIR